MEGYEGCNFVVGEGVMKRLSWGGGDEGSE